MSTTESITVEDLYARINRGGKVIVQNYERTIREFYPWDDTEDSMGYVQAAELTITHDKDRKRYRAEVSLARVRSNQGWFAQSFSIGGGRIGEQFMVEPTARYNRVKLADFTLRARAQVARMGVGV